MSENRKEKAKSKLKRKALISSNEISKKSSLIEKLISSADIKDKPKSKKTEKRNS